MGRQDELWSPCAYRVHRARNPQSRDVPEKSSRWEAARAGGKAELGENAISSVCVFIRCNLFSGPTAHLYFVLFKRGTDSLKGPASSFFKTLRDKYIYHYVLRIAHTRDKNEIRTI